MSSSGKEGQTLAHQMVGRALRSGELVRKVCERCGAANTDAHHEDYARPLDVTWLCRRCHARHHAPERRRPPARVEIPVRARAVMAPSPAAPAPIERLAYSATEVGEIFGVDRKTVYAWINEGWLRIFHAGRVMRISRDALLEFIAEREEEEGWR